MVFCVYVAVFWPTLWSFSVQSHHVLQFAPNFAATTDSRPTCITFEKFPHINGPILIEIVPRATEDTRTTVHTLIYLVVAPNEPFAPNERLTPTLTRATAMMGTRVRMQHNTTPDVTRHSGERDHRPLVIRQNLLSRHARQVRRHHGAFCSTALRREERQSTHFSKTVFSSTH